jgi:hypothetical protein
VPRATLPKLLGETSRARVPAPRPPGQPHQVRTLQGLGCQRVSDGARGLQRRVVIVGGPSRGKSTLADRLHAETGCPVYCGDPASTVRYQYPYVTYLPEGLDFHGDNGCAAYIAEHWIGSPGPWIAEGHAMARALRRYLRDGCRRGLPAERIIVLDCPAHRVETPGQARMHRGVMTVWRGIEHDPALTGRVERVTDVQPLPPNTTQFQAF